MCSSSKQFRKDLGSTEDQSASGKVKALPSVVALEAPFPLQTWFLKVLLSIFENKLISLKFGMPYLFWGGVPATPPRTLTEEERQSTVQRYDCQNISLFIFLEATPVCGLKRSQPLLCVYSHIWQCLVVFGNEKDDILKEWLSFLNDKIVIIPHVSTTVSSLVMYRTLLFSRMNLEIYLALILKIKCIW